MRASFTRSLLHGAAFLTGAVVLAVPGPAVAQDSPPPLAPQPPPNGAPAWLGVSMDKGGDTGVRIETVIRGSPAERGGLRIADRIVAIDGLPVTTPGQVTRAVGARKVGETVTVGLERAGTPINAPVVLAVRPSNDDLVRMQLVGAPAPEWRNVTTLAGAPPSVAALRGRVAIIDFWASWCGPCRMVTPRLNALKDRLAAQGLSVVGVTTDPAEQAATFAERLAMRYPSVVDKDGQTSRAYGIIGLPTMVVVDKKGIVRNVFVGFDPQGEARLEAEVKKLLAEPGPPAVPPPTAPRPDAR